MKRLFTVLKGFVSLAFLLVLVVTACYVGVFLVERHSTDKIYLYNYAFVAEKEDDGLHMWFVKRVPFAELETGDGVIYYADNGYRSSRCEAGENTLAFYRGETLNEAVDVTRENFVGQVVAEW